MEGPPPPYDEVAAQGTPPLEPALQLVVRLQVWHCTSEGRSPRHNEALAAIFSNHNLEDWEVVPLEVDGITGPSSHDLYVPVEVQFSHRVWAYNDPGEHPRADLRRLFFKIAPQFIYQFFIEINSTPHNLNIFPIRVPEEFISDYTHAYNLNQLSIRVNAFFVPGPVQRENVQGWLRDAVNTSIDTLDILAAIVSLYLRYRQTQQQANINRQGRIQDEARNANVLNVDVPQELEDLRALFNQFRLPNPPPPPRVQIADIQAAFDNAASPLQQYLRLTNRMETRLQKLQNDEILSNQDLYELVHDAHASVLVISTLREAVLPLVRLLEQDYGAVMEAYRSKQIKTAACSAIITGAAVFFWWNPVGWLAGYTLGGTVVGGLAGAGAHCVFDSKRGKAFAKKERVRDFKISIANLGRNAKQAQEAIAMVFCEQVMRKRLDNNLPEHDKRATLATFGVDVDYLTNITYNMELIRDRVAALRENNDGLRRTVERVMADANLELETTEQAI